MASPTAASDGSSNDTISIVNARLILPTHAVPVSGSIRFSTSTGRITSIAIDDDHSTPLRPVCGGMDPSATTTTAAAAAAATASTTSTPDNIQTIDLHNQILAPGFLDLQTNGMAGVHFTKLASRLSTTSTSTAETLRDREPYRGDDDDDDVARLTKCASLLATSGTTAFWATIPTVPQHRWREILPVLQPRSFSVAVRGDDPTASYSSTTNTTRTSSNKAALRVNQSGVIPEHYRPVGATLLGAHVEGPYLAPSKRGAHAAEYMLTPEPSSSSSSSSSPAKSSRRDPSSSSSSSSFETLYGTASLASVVKMITLAPELPGALDLIRSLRERYPHIRISLGHSAASYDEALAAVDVGASMVTHVFNAMNGWTGRDPGLPGLMMQMMQMRPVTTFTSTTTTTTTTSPPPQPRHRHRQSIVYYSIIADSIHLSPQTTQLALQLGLDDDGLGGGRCIAITDAIELAGLPDGVYEGNGQILGRQVKTGGNRVVKQGTATLIGSCVLLDQCVRVLVGVGVMLLLRERKLERATGGWRKDVVRREEGEEDEDEDEEEEEKEEEKETKGGEEQEERDRSLVIAVKCVSQNVAEMMGEEDRGRLEVGRRADFVVLGWDPVKGKVNGEGECEGDADTDTDTDKGAGTKHAEDQDQQAAAAAAAEEVVVRETWIGGWKVFERGQ